MKRRRQGPSADDWFDPHDDIPYGMEYWDESVPQYLDPLSGLGDFYEGTQPHIPHTGALRFAWMPGNTPTIVRVIANDGHFVQVDVVHGFPKGTGLANHTVHPSQLYTAKMVRDMGIEAGICPNLEELLAYLDDEPVDAPSDDQHLEIPE